MNDADRKEIGLFAHASMCCGGMLFRVSVEYDAVRQADVFMIVDDLTSTCCSGVLSEIEQAIQTMNVKREMSLLHLMQHVTSDPERHAAFLKATKDKL